MSGGHGGGGGDRVPREWSATNINHNERGDGSYNTNITYERGGGDHGGGHEGHGGKRWGWGKTLLLIAAMAGVGTAAFYGGRAVEGGNAERAGEPSRGENPDDGDPVATNPAPVEAAQIDQDETVITEEHEGEITVAGNIGQLEMEVPRNIETVERGGVNYTQVTLVFEDPPRDGQVQFRACEGDEGCADALDGVANAGNLGVLTGTFSVEVPDGEPDKRMVSYSVPERVTWRGRTITINPDTTRVRAGNGEFVLLREVLGEPRD